VDGPECLSVNPCRSSGYNQARLGVIPQHPSFFFSTSSSQPHFLRDVTDGTDSRTGQRYSEPNQSFAVLIPRRWLRLVIYHRVSNSSSRPPVGRISPAREESLGPALVVLNFHYRRLRSSTQVLAATHLPSNTCIPRPQRNVQLG
jgi:hypothetical protein